MTPVTLRKSGNSYIVTVPAEVVQKYGWKEGQQLDLELRELEVTYRPVLRPELKELAEESWQRNEEAYRYLAER